VTRFVVDAGAVLHLVGTELEISSEHELLPDRIPERDREITLDLVYKVDSAFFVEMQNGFGVSAR